MLKKKKNPSIHLELNTYNSVEGQVLIHAHYYDWHITPETRKDCRAAIGKIVIAEQAKERILIFLENGKQLVGKGKLF